MRITLLPIYFIVYFGLAAIASAEEKIPSPLQDGLEFALQSAIQLNPVIQSGRSNAIALGYDLDSAKSRILPSIVIQGETADTDDSDTETRQLVARLQQPIWVGGRITDSISIARIQREIGQLQLLRIQRELIEETAVTYASLYELRKQLRTANDNVKEHNELYNLVSRRNAGSVASRADVLIAKSRLAQALSQREQIKGQLLKIRSDLYSLSQRPVHALKPVTAAIRSLPVPEQIITEMVQSSIALKLQKKQVELVRAQIELSKAEMMPSVYFKVDRDLYHQRDQEDVPLETRYGLVIESSLEGGGFSKWNALKASRSRVTAARADVEATVNDTERLARTLIEERTYLKQVIKANRILVKVSSDSLASFTRQYEAGRKTWVDVLNAQKEYAAARQSLDQSESLLLQNDLKLAAKTGLLDQLAGVQHEYTE